MILRVTRPKPITAHGLLHVRLFFPWMNCDMNPLARAAGLVLTSFRGVDLKKYDLYG